MLDDWDHKGIVASPDVDGMLSSALVAKATGAKLVGVYTTSNLLLLDGTTHAQARDALWLDHDISHPGVRCVGQHLVNHAPGDALGRRHEPSFNPNAHYGQAWTQSFAGFGKPKRDKYPFGTSHFLLSGLGLPEPKPGTKAYSLLAHADGTWATALDYNPNANLWLALMYGEKDALLRDLAAGTYTTASNLARHKAVVADLVACGVKTRGSRERTSPHVPAEWQPLQGHQSVSYSAGNDAQRWLDKLNALVKYVSSTTGWSLALPTRVSEAIRCEYRTEFPDRIDVGTFDQWLDANNVFSHAFTGRSSLRFTVGPVLEA